MPFHISVHHIKSTQLTGQKDMQYCMQNSLCGEKQPLNPILKHGSGSMMLYG